MNNSTIIVKSNNSWIESIAEDQLERTSQLQGILKAVGMPDLHPAKTPNGASYLTQDVIYPHIIGNDIGCGIALYETNLKQHKFDVEKTKNKLERFEKLSDIDLYTDFEETPMVDFPTTNKLGTIGSGNHFGEFQSIDTIENTDLFDQLSLSKKKMYLLVHTGSRNYGDYILENIFDGSVPTSGLMKNTHLFTTYLNAHNNALKYAKLNRYLVAQRILSVVQSQKPQLLFESVHNAITEKVVDGAPHYIHRKGAAPSNIGPVVIAGSRDTPSYIVIPNAEISDYLYSISHGAGRKWHRSGCKDRLRNKYGRKNIKNASRPTLVCHNKALYYEESPDAYKNITQVIDDLLEHNMITIVATLKPRLTIKI